MTPDLGPLMDPTGGTAPRPLLQAILLPTPLNNNGPRPIHHTFTV